MDAKWHPHLAFVKFPLLPYHYCLFKVLTKILLAWMPSGPLLTTIETSISSLIHGSLGNLRDTHAWMSSGILLSRPSITPSPSLLSLSKIQETHMHGCHVAFSCQGQIILSFFLIIGHLGNLSDFLCMGTKWPFLQPLKPLFLPSPLVYSKVYETPIV